jgi:phosphoglycolate phosphatase
MDRSNHERRLALASACRPGTYGGDQVSDTRPVSLVCCGLIGTTVTDNGMVERAYAEAIATQGVVTGTTAYARCMAGVHRSRGQSTIEVLRSLFPESQARAQAAQLAFDRSYSAAVARTDVVAMPGAEQAIEKLRGTGAQVCLISGFSRRVLDLVIDTLGWWDRIDLALSPDEVPRGCPWPDLVFTAMLRLGVDDVRDAIVAHGTESGVLSGRRSGVGTVVGVLTGTHTTERLRRAGASHVLGSVAELPDLLAAGTAPGTSAAADPASADARSAPGSGSYAAGAGARDDGRAAQVPLERRSTGL